MSKLASLTANKMCFGSLVALLAIGAFAQVGCSAREAFVANEPPVIKKDLVTFDIEFGTFEPDARGITVFLWPEGLTESQAETVVRTVKGASARVDQIKIDLYRVSVEEAKLQAVFKGVQCVAKWAEQVAASGPDSMEWVSKWKDAPEDATARAEHEACVQNQTRRQEILTTKSASMKELTQLGGLIMKTIDPEFPAKQVNYKSITAKGSKIVLRPTESPTTNGVLVDITLRDFFVIGNVQSTEAIIPADADEITRTKAAAHRIVNARYHLPSKLLTFAVPEVNEQGAMTGAMYEFALERTPDFMGFARFSGDMKLVRNGVVLRYGSAQIDGLLK